MNTQNENIPRVMFYGLGIGIIASIIFASSKVDNDAEVAGAFVLIAIAMLLFVLGTQSGQNAELSQIRNTVCAPVTVFIVDATQCGFADRVTEERVGSYRVKREHHYVRHFDCSPWGRVPVKEEEMVVAGNSLVVGYVYFKLDGTIEVHVIADETDQVDSWHEGVADEGFELVPA